MAIFVGIKKAKILLTRPISVQGFRVEDCMSKSAMSSKNTKEAASAVEEQRQVAAEPPPPRVWVPHPPTGIYFPKGQERVMEGIPNEATSFDQTFWLRNIDGVDKPEPPYP